MTDERKVLRMRPEECCVLIPSLSPDERLPRYVQELLRAGYGRIVVVDDGSAESYQPIFDRIAGWEGCVVRHHPVNRGKGAALRTGYRYILDETDHMGIVTADSDGQHTVPDTLKLTEKLSDKRELLLGSRDFSRKSKNVPFRSRFGNRTTSVVFRLLYGRWLPDTQTGLRALPRELLAFSLGVPGNRFEYEMNQLVWCAKKKVPITVMPIETVYLEENKSSHFHPLRDTWRIYKPLFGNLFKKV